MCIRIQASWLQPQRRCWQACPTACKMWQNTRIHTHTQTHTCACECPRDINHKDNLCQETSTVGEGYYLGGPQKTQGKTAILSFTLHFYSATFCTFTARPPKKRSNTKNIALLQRFAMQVTVPRRLAKAPDLNFSCDSLSQPMPQVTETIMLSWYWQNMSIML